MDALSRMIEAVKPGGLILDLQVVRPNPQVEVNGRAVGELDGEALRTWAEAATAAVDTRILAGDLVEEAVDEHDVLRHYPDGAELVHDYAESKTRVPLELVPVVAVVEEPLAVKERCRLRRLRVVAKELSE